MLEAKAILDRSKGKASAKYDKNSKFLKRAFFISRAQKNYKIRISNLKRI